MTIASEITRIKTNINNAYTALEAKGATIPEAKNSANLADTINTVTGGSEPSNGEYCVKVIDYDGTILKQSMLNEGDTFTLPDDPVQERLIFQGWVSPVDIVNNSITVPAQDVTIGPMYDTKSGDLELTIRLTPKTGLTVEYSNVIDWGDGTAADGTNTHTYANYGDYRVILDGPSNIGFWFSGKTEIISVSVPSIFTGIGTRAFSGTSLQSISMPNTITSISSMSFALCYGLKAIVLPSSLTISSRMSSTYSLEDVVIPKQIGYYHFEDCFALKYVPMSPTTKYISSMLNCTAITKVNVPESVTKISAQQFKGCKSLRNVKLNNFITTIEGDAFQDCYSLEELDFSQYTAIPTLSGSLGSNFLNTFQIKVPAALEAEWKAAENWADVADYIVSDGQPETPTKVKLTLVWEDKEANNGATFKQITVYAEGDSYIITSAQNKEILVPTNSDFTISLTTEPGYTVSPGKLTIHVADADVTYKISDNVTLIANP